MFKSNGSTHRGEIKQSGGGVGRNMADALAKLGANPFLISAIGVDQTGEYLLQSTLNHVDTRGVVRVSTERTACYSAVVDRHGECYFGVGDMDINNTITPKLVENFLDEIHQSSLVVMDGNIPIETMDYVLNVCRTAMIPGRERHYCYQLREKLI
ncbi:Pseudouridine kinase [Blattella germanica]|nr:Pseudouridine kinase [Blattella germanica]